MGRINYDINKYYKKHGLTLNDKVKAKLKVQKLQNSDFCTKMQEIMDPILESFNAILEKGENTIISNININRVINDILILMLVELEKVENNKEKNWLSDKNEKKLVTTTLTFN